MKLAIFLCTLLGLITNVNAQLNPKFYGTYKGMVDLNADGEIAQLKATANVLKSSEEVTKATITFTVSGSVISHVVKFREDGSISGRVLLNGDRVASLSGTWVLEETSYRYSGRIRLGLGWSEAIRGSINFRSGGNLVAKGHLSGNESFKFVGAKK